MGKKVELFVAYLGMYAAALSFTIIFPFASDMVMKFGGASDRDSTGFWVGMIATSVMIGRVVSSPFWGYIIDIWGRKGVTQFSLVWMIILQILFGLSKSILSAIIIRLFIGLLTPLMISSKTLVSELWKDNMSEAMVWITITWNIGSISGSVIGGVLSDPNSSGFTNSSFFEDYPYFLCSLIPSIICLIALILGFIYLKETLVKSGPSLVSQKTRSIREITFDRKVFPILIAYLIYCFNSTAFLELITLFAWSKRKSGGLEYSPSKIGYLLGISNIVLLLVQRNMYLRLENNLGVWKMGKYTWALIPVITLIIPLVSFIKNDTALYVLIIILCTVWMFLEFCICTCALVALNNSVPHCELGKITGISMSLNCLFRAFAPATVGILFSATIKNSVLPHPLNYSIVFYSLAAIQHCGYWCFIKINKSCEKPYNQELPDVPLIDIHNEKLIKT